MPTAQKPSGLGSALGLSLLLAGCGSTSDETETIWPIGGTLQLRPISSSFGPRLQRSNGGVYDFHRGIDIPTPIGTLVVSIAPGTVRRAGKDPKYADTVVQIEHCEGRSTCIYST